MAVVFISPKQRMRVFFMGITAVFILFLIVVTLWAFFSEPQKGSYEVVFNKPKVNINLNLLNSEEFQKLETYPKIETQYAYTATTKTGKSVNGFVSAVSEIEARRKLSAMSLEVGSIKEAEVGRDNPFEPYE